MDSVLLSLLQHNGVPSEVKSGACSTPQKAPGVSLLDNAIVSQCFGALSGLCRTPTEIIGHVFAFYAQNRRTRRTSSAMLLGNDSIVYTPPPKDLTNVRDNVGNTRERNVVDAIEAADYMLLLRVNPQLRSLVEKQCLELETGACSSQRDAPQFKLPHGDARAR
ncbi:hypothetical protein C8R44DRAFT_741236 [Mycena epipterygia]|nr:hypothetical protein C8R44DRAFT_741236 [Mycena epipterygia]